MKRMVSCRICGNVSECVVCQKCSQESNPKVWKMKFKAKKTDCNSFSLFLKDQMNRKDAVGCLSRIIFSDIVPVRLLQKNDVASWVEYVAKENGSQMYSMAVEMAWKEFVCGDLGALVARKIY